MCTYPCLKSHELFSIARAKVCWTQKVDTLIFVLATSKLLGKPEGSPRSIQHNVQEETQNT